MQGKHVAPAGHACRASKKSALTSRCGWAVGSREIHDVR